MNILKKSLAMFLVMCMLLSAVPMTAFATETDIAEQIETILADQVTENAEDYSLTTLDLESDVSAASISSITMGTKPSGGTTTGEPFPQGTGESNSFRIPALATLANGNLIAAADARWNTTYDGGGLDTIVSISSDNGDTWNYSYANYLGDNGNVYNGSESTAFIDPALAVTGNTVYMLVDLYPYGIALNGSGHTSPTTSAGFYVSGDNVGKLALTGNNFSSFDYYLDKNPEGGYLIYNNDGTLVSDYTVDDYFNITGTDGTSSNLFFSNSPYKVTRTGYLYLTKSTDAGATWSAPELLNVGRESSSEMVTLVAPGRGLVTSTGKIVFPVYSFYGDNDPSGNTQRMSFIYSDDNGATWTRSATRSVGNANWASESAVVELEDGTLRFFFRNGTTNLCYVDYNNGWGSAVTMTDIDTNSNCQMSAITYSKTIDGKQVILVSCPTGPSEAGSNQSSASYRKNGKIFAFTVESDNSLTKVGSISVTSNDNYFMYSCLTELSDGTVGILYEDNENAWGTGTNCYYTMSYGEYDLSKTMGLTFDTDTSTEEPEVETKVTVADEGLTVESETEVTEIEGLTDFVAYDITLSKNGTAYTDAATVTIPLNGKFADQKLWGFVLESDGTITYVKENVVRDTVNDTVSFTAPHFSTVGALPASEDVTGEATVDVRIPVGDTSKTYTDTTGNYENNVATAPNNTVVEMTVAGTTVEGSTIETVATSISAGSAYYIKNESGKYLSASATWVDSIKDAAQWTAVDNSNSNYRTRLKNGSNYLRYYNSTYSTTTKESSGTRYYYVNNAFNTSSYNNGTSLGSAVTVTTTDPVAATDVTFKGLKAGTTTAKVGNVTYNITVYEEKSITINYQVDGKTVTTGTVKVASDATTATLPTTVVDASGNTYIVESTTLNLTTATTYNVPVTLKEGEDITVAVGGTAEIDVDLADGQYVKWETESDHYVGVAGVFDTTANAYTDTAVIVGNNVTETDQTVLVKGTVYNADGSVAGIYKWLVTVTASTSTNNTSKYICINIPRIQNCTVYYAINAGELIEITSDKLDGPYTDDDGTYYKLNAALMDQQYTGGFQISFFAKPDDGYALTYMSSTNSAGQYYVLSDGNPDGTGSSAWPFNSGVDYESYTSADGYNTDTFKHDGSYHGLTWGLCEGNFTVAQLRVMLTKALNVGCDGMLVFTKNSTDGLNSELGFIAEKLPEMYKVLSKVSYVNSEGETVYVDADKVENIGIGYTLHYTIYVAVPTVANSNSVEIAYSNIVVTDKLTEDVWSVDSATSEDKATSFIWNNTTKSVTAYASTDTWKNPLTDGSVTTFPIDSFTYTNNAGKSVAYSDSTSNIYAFNSTITLGASNFLSVVKDGKITNTADLEYTYKGKYSVGSLDKTSSAVVDVLVEVPEYVIDFGLPVEIDLTNDPLVKGDKIVDAKANYGDVTITGDRTIVYTPTQILPGTDFIVLTFYENAASDGTNSSSTAIVGYGVRIYPATTVYYEESFLNTDANWTAVVTAKNTSQSAVELGSAGENNYGYDAVYADDGDCSSNGTYITSDNGGLATFTFTGTGFELYANSDTTSGYVTVYSQGKLSKLYMINTILTPGTTPATDQQTGDTYYSLPIISETDLPYGEYTVQLKQTKGDAYIYIDGVRIINTLEDSTVFTVDEEDKPVFHELRDYVLNAVGVENLADSEYTDSNDRIALVDTVKEMSGQVYNALEAGTKAVVINKDGTSFTTAQAQDLLDNGPKNELYLYPGQTLAFSVETARVMQLGLKSPTGSAEFTLTVDDKTLDLDSVTSTVDMFYKIADKGGTTHVVSITVPEDSTGVLSVTDLKICDDPNFTFNDLTQEDIENVLLDLYDLNEETEDNTEEPTEPEAPVVPEEPVIPEEPVVVYADAVLGVNVVDYTGKVLGTAELTANGVEGETATFTAEDILAAAKEQIPEKYALVDESAVATVDVVYGETSETEVQVGKVATLKITFVNLIGRKTGSETISMVQTSAGNWKVSASEICALAPTGRYALWLLPVSISYGNTKSIVVPVL